MSSVTVNLESVDAMFATIIAEQKASLSAINARFDTQDTALAAIEVQTTLTNGKVAGLLERERDLKVRLATLATVFSALGTGLVWLADKLLRV